VTTVSKPFGQPVSNADPTDRHRGGPRQEEADFHPLPSWTNSSVVPVRWPPIPSAVSRPPWPGEPRGHRLVQMADDSVPVVQGQDVPAQLVGSVFGERPSELLKDGHGHVDL
jgi:hypothetical protein